MCELYGVVKGDLPHRGTSKCVWIVYWRDVFRAGASLNIHVQCIPVQLKWRVSLRLGILCNMYVMTINEVEIFDALTIWIMRTFDSLVNLHLDWCVIIIIFVIFIVFRMLHSNKTLSSIRGLIICYFLLFITAFHW